VVAGLVGAVIGGIVVRPSSSAGPELVCNASHVAEHVLPSVVTISASGADGSGTGSGEVIRGGGYILTNQHVIAPASRSGQDGRLIVHYSDGAESPATLVGEDVATDLAVIKAEDNADGRPIMDLGSSDELAVGRPAVALGAPLGLSNTVTTGVISALGRYVPVPTGTGGVHHLIDAIQTDAAINPGNSGGPLVDCDGALIGVNSAISTVPNAEGVGGGGSVGLGFAIPVSVAKPIADALITTGHANHPVMGLAAYPVESPGDTTPQGLLVTVVTPQAPAERAGLRPGDLITEIDGERANSADQLVLATLTRSAGDTLPITIQRGGSSRSLEITLAAQ
jgi:putative serine protease PepD